eukprot:1157689-Pelagomonas_calceolata.AAC.6
MENICWDHGLKAAVENEMFVTEAYEDRKKGAFEHLGEVGRVLRRYQQQPDRSTLQLSHCIRSIDQPCMTAVHHCWDNLRRKARGVACDGSLSLAGASQVGALADVLVQLPELETLLLAGNDLDDQAFSMLGSQELTSRVEWRLPGTMHHNNAPLSCRTPHMLVSLSPERAGLSRRGQPHELGLVRQSVGAGIHEAAAAPLASRQAT